MPRYIFDFDLDAWIQGVKIEAKNLKEAKEKFCSMSIEDLLDEGYVKNYSIKNIDAEEEDEDYE